MASSNEPKQTFKEQYEARYGKIAERGEQAVFTPTPEKPLPSPELEKATTFRPERDWKAVEYAWKRGGKPEETDPEKPTVYVDPEGVRHYTPDSTMWQLGYKTDTEYKEKGQWLIGFADVAQAAPNVAIKDKHISKETAITLAGMKGEEQFEALVQVGVIPRGSEYIPSEKPDELRYIPPPTKAIAPPQVAKEQGLITLPDGMMISVEDAESIREQSSYGYNILTREGYYDYLNAVEEAQKAMEPYRRDDGYRLKVAVAEGIPKNTLSLLFRPEDVEEAWKVKATPDEKAEEYGVPPALLATLPVGAVVATLEPTPVGELLIATAVLGAMAYYAAIGKDVEWGKVWDSITDTFKEQIGRNPTKPEAESLQATAANIIAISGTPVKGMPFEIESPDVKIPPITLELKKPIETQLIPPQVEPALPGTRAMRETMRLPGVAMIPSDPMVEVVPMQGKVVPDIMIAQTAVATAERELDGLWVIIRPQITETGKYLPAKIPRTETALVALDKAVSEAYGKGRINETTFRAYSRARQNYLTKKNLLNSAMKAYTGGATPRPVGNIDYVSGLAILSAMNSLQELAHKIATDAYNDAIGKDMTQPQARTYALEQAQTAVNYNMEEIIQSAVQQAMQTMASPATDVATRTAIQSAVRTAVAHLAPTLARAIPLSATAVATGVRAITPSPIAPPPPFLLPGSARKRKGQVKVPDGSIVFAMGRHKGASQGQWYVIKPPWTANKPESLTAPPIGARNIGSASPYDTIQVIGKAKGLPKTMSFDLGITDGYISNYGTKIKFSGNGERTDVGTRLDETTKGLSIPAVSPRHIKRKPRKRLSNYDYMTTLKGFKP